MPEGSKVPTGIKGFDELVKGGLYPKSINVLRGGAGTGKTSFCLEFLYNGCTKYGEHGLFISFEESKESVYDTALGFGWDFKKLEDKKHFIFLNYAPHDFAKMLSEGGAMISDIAESIGAKRVVIDSLSAYSMFFKTEYESDQGVLNLMELLKSWKATVLVTDEKNVDVDNPPSERLGFLSDGLVNFYYIRRNGAKLRALEVIKMRHVKHSEQLALFTIENKGIEIYAAVDLIRLNQKASQKTKKG